MKELEELREAFKEKYAELIKDLATKYDVDMGEGYDRLRAIAFCLMNGEEPEYEPTIEYNKEELVEDYRPIYEKSCETAKEKGNI